MAAGDQGGPAPEGGGKGIPMWVIIGGVVAVAGFLWFRSRSGTGGASANTSALQPGVVTDPNTGMPVDPLTGLPYISGSGGSAQTNDTWAVAAEQWAIKNGISAALANKSIYDYLNGNSLTTQESDILNKILSGFGFPPNILPFFGSPSSGHGGGGQGGGQGASGSHTATTPHFNAGSFPARISAILSGIVMAKIPKGGSVQYGAPVYALVNTIYGPVYEQGAAVTNCIRTGCQLYTLPQFAKYILGPPKKKAA